MWGNPREPGGSIHDHEDGWLLPSSARSVVTSGFNPPAPLSHLSNHSLALRNIPSSWRSSKVAFILTLGRTMYEFSKAF